MGKRLSCGLLTGLNCFGRTLHVHKLSLTRKISRHVHLKPDVFLSLCWHPATFKEQKEVGLLVLVSSLLKVAADDDETDIACESWSACKLPITQAGVCLV